jgi:hypothetical protein
VVGYRLEVSVRSGYLYQKTGGEENDGLIDASDLCGLFSSRTFLGIHQSDEVSELSIKVTKFPDLKRSNEVTRVTTTLLTRLRRRAESTVKDPVRVWVDNSIPAARGRRG